MATTTTTITPITVAQAKNYYVNFDQTKDVIYYSGKKNIQRSIPLNQGCTFSKSADDMTYDLKYDGNIVGTAITVDKNDLMFKSLKTLLCSDKTKTDWQLPDRGSTVKVVDSISIISFNNNLIYDKLALEDSSNDPFSFTIKNDTYTVAQSSDATGINIDFRRQSSNFGHLMLGGSRVNGYFFGQLGLIMLYKLTGGALPSEINDSLTFTASRVIAQNYVNSYKYFCRITNQKFNYSDNPSWSEIGSSQQPFTAVTTIGLYDDEQLLAIAKLSEPMLKREDTEIHANIVLKF